MNFYSSMAPVYDKVFPLRPVQVKFTLDELDGFESDKSILDVGCATGNLVLELQKEKVNAQGMDLDEEMVDIANRAWNGDKELFKVCNMLEVKETYPDNSFRVVTCYGNTIVHLGFESEIRNFFSSVFSLLKDQGRFLGQIINYDRILDMNIDSLPTIENEHIRFKRDYLLTSDKTRIDFNTELYIKETEQILKSSVELLPLRKNQLKRLLNQAGFSGIEFWGGFNKCPLDDDTQPIVFRAFKS